MENKLEEEYIKIKENCDLHRVSFLEDLEGSDFLQEGKELLFAYFNEEEEKVQLKDAEKRLKALLGEWKEKNELIRLANNIKKFYEEKKKQDEDIDQNNLEKLEQLIEHGKKRLDLQEKKNATIFNDFKAMKIEYATKKIEMLRELEDIKIRKKKAYINKKINEQIFARIRENLETIHKLVSKGNYINNLFQFLLCIDEKLNNVFNFNTTLSRAKNINNGLHQNIKIYKAESQYFTVTNLAYYNGLIKKRLLVNTQELQFFSLTNTTYFPVKMNSILCFNVSELSYATNVTQANNFLIEMFTVYLYLLTGVDNYKSKVLSFKYMLTDSHSFNLKTQIKQKTGLIFSHLSKDSVKENYINEISLFLFYYLEDRENGLSDLILRNNKGEEHIKILEFLVVLHTIQYIMNNARNFIEDEEEYEQFVSHLSKEKFDAIVEELKEETFYVKSQSKKFTKKMLNTFFPTFIKNYMNDFEEKKKGE